MKTNQPKEKDMPEYDVKIERWDNDRARYALGRAPAGQRDVDGFMVKAFRGLWERGLWSPLIGAPMCWMEDGSFGNGNHRASFIATLPAGVTVPVLVAHDVPMGMLPYMDGGKNRTLGHHLRYVFPAESQRTCTIAGSLASIAMTYHGPPALPKVDLKPDPHLAVAWTVEHAPRLFAAAKEAARISRLERDQPGCTLTPRTLGFVLYLLDNPDATRFFENLSSRDYNGNQDVRGAYVKHYSRPINAYRKGAQGREVTLQRIADMFGLWDAHQRGVQWKPWLGDTDKFRHPPVKHPTPNEDAA